MMRRISLNGGDWLLKEFVGLDWVWRGSVDPETSDTRRWIPARVPGTVLHDLWRAGKVPDPYFELNSKLVEWVPARTWVYRKRFRIPAGEEKHAELRFEGVDYCARVFLNGEELGGHEGMYTPFSFDVTGKLRFGEEENLLAVVVERAPDEQPQVGKTSLVHTHKSRMTYWWDFCPRMIHQGIWDGAEVLLTGEERLTDVYLTAQIDEDFAHAVVTAQIEARCADGCIAELQFGEFRTQGSIRNGRVQLDISLERPRLWQPNGYGAPYQYNVLVRLLRGQDECEQKEFRYGLRKLEWLRNEGAPDTAPPFRLRVNGREIFINGYNWVPMDALYGVERPERLSRLLRLAREAGCVMLRVWGGGLIEKDNFYERCAENGILVWQEFIQSSSGIENCTPQDAEYRAFLVREAVEIVRRKRNHTALAVWCGGNELQDLSGNPLDDSDPLLRALREVVERLDPSRRWLPTSPSGGVFLNSLENIENHPDEMCDVHGPWEHQGIERHCTLYNRGACLLHSEFGVEGMTNPEVLERTIAPEHRFPAGKDNEVHFHRGAWWNNEPLLQRDFGGVADLDEIRRASQYLQYEGLKYALECARRRAFRCGGTFPWQFNEPYPNSFCTSNIDYDSNPKPAYYGVRRAYAPFAATAAFDSPSLSGQDRLACTLYASCALEASGPFRLTANVLAMDGRTIWEGTFPCAPPPDNRAAEAGRIDPPLSASDGILLALRLELLDGNGKRLAENEYLFTREKTWRAMLSLEGSRLCCAPCPGGIELENSGTMAALWVFLSDASPLPEKDGLYFQDNYFLLFPGERRFIAVSGGNGRAVRVEHFGGVQKVVLNQIGGVDMDESNCGH